MGKFGPKKQNFFYQNVWGPQNETGVKKVDIKCQAFKKCQIFLVFIINYNRTLKQFIQLIENIFQHKVDCINLLNSILRVPSKSKMFMSNFPSLISK